jgi:hypothetical protein
LNPAQRAAVGTVLRRITPPAGFRQYLHWSLTRTAAKPSVPCTPTTGICFASDDLLDPLTAARARALITRFGVHVQQIACLVDNPGLVTTLNSCVGQGSFSRYHLGIMVTILHPPHPNERSGTQVMFYGGRHE